MFEVVQETEIKCKYSKVSIMGDQKFVCGRYKNRTFEEIAKSDPEFCEKVWNSNVNNKYYPLEFKNYLQSLTRPLINVSNVTSFVKQWDGTIRNEFRSIIGMPAIAIRQVHPRSDASPNGNLGVFIRYFAKKCIFNAQNANASNYYVGMFASLFPFKVDKMAAVVPAALPVMRLFDNKFYADVDVFLRAHFDDTYNVEARIALLLSNVFRFRAKYFDEVSIRKLKNVVEDAQDADRNVFTAIYVNDYMRHFPRLNQAGVARFNAFRQDYNSLCDAFGCEKLDEQRRLRIRMLPEITCHEVLSLLEPDLWREHREKYVELLQKYLFFFNYAVECERAGNPVFFIDDPLYECLKGYAEYRRSRGPAEDQQLCVWLMTLVHRRTQESNSKKLGFRLDVDEHNLRHIREYVENFAGIESAIMDFTLPTNLLLLGIPIVTADRLLNVFYSSVERSSLSDFYELIIRALMYPASEIRQCVIYNAYTGVETSVDVPTAVRQEVLDFVRRHNGAYDATQPIPVEAMFTENLEHYFECKTIQWETKYAQKPNPVPAVQL